MREKRLTLRNLFNFAEIDTNGREEIAQRKSYKVKKAQRKSYKVKKAKP